MGLDGYQLFVRSDDAEAVEAAIRAYVKDVGCDGVEDPDIDELSGIFADREDRQFVLSTVRDATICVWEDGSWADRRLAKVLSHSLTTQTVWLMVSDSTDSWAYAVYDAGKEVRREHRQPDDVLGEAEKFARKERLPFALQYFDEPDRPDSDFEREFEEELERRGLADRPGTSPEVQAALRASPEEAAAFGLHDRDDDADEDAGAGIEPGDDIDLHRSEFTEFTQTCKGR